MYKLRVFLFTIKELKRFLLLFNFSRLMNKKTEEEAVEAFQRRVFSPFLAAVSRLSACPFI